MDAILKAVRRTETLEVEARQLSLTGVTTKTTMETVAVVSVQVREVEVGDEESLVEVAEQLLTDVVLREAVREGADEAALGKLLVLS